MAVKKLLMLIWNHYKESMWATGECRSFLEGNWETIQRAFHNQHVLKEESGLYDRDNRSESKYPEAGLLFQLTIRLLYLRILSGFWNNIDYTKI